MCKHEYTLPVEELEKGREEGKKEGTNGGEVRPRIHCYYPPPRAGVVWDVRFRVGGVHLRAVADDAPLVPRVMFDGSVRTGLELNLGDGLLVGLAAYPEALGVEGERLEGREGK